MCAAVIEKRKSALGSDRTFLVALLLRTVHPNRFSYPTTGYFLLLWKYTFGRIGEDWLFLALLGGFPNRLFEL